ncbi:MAG: hypothetical protein EXR50_07385 [Dehalococcoidia bacterium]|nr:hypothetical protein [Dehalococcoidia bacterium]
MARKILAPLEVFSLLKDALLLVAYATSKLLVQRAWPPVIRLKWLRFGIEHAALTLAVWAGLNILVSIVFISISQIFAGLTNWWPVQRAAALAPGDDLHALIALNMLGDIQNPRLSLRLPGSDLLSQIAPGQWAPTAWLPDDTWFGTIFAPGSSAVGIHAASLLLNTTFVIAGVLLTAAVAKRYSSSAPSSWTKPAISVLLMALLMQGYGVAAQLQLPWSGDSGGGVALSFIATKTLGLDHSRFELLVSSAAWMIPITLNVIVLSTAFAIAIGLTSLLGVKIQLERGAVFTRISPLFIVSGRVCGPLVLVLAVLLFQTPLTHSFSFEPTPAYATEEPAALKSVDRFQEMPIDSRPSVVTVSADSSGFSYYVNGVQTQVRGVGYNLASVGGVRLSKAARYERDFASISSLGFNTIIGWNQEQFDELLLEKAAQYQLGVVLPFELDPKWNYQDPQIRRQLMDKIRIWVERYKFSPAIRMWGLGNEVIHGIGISQPQKTKAFASFLLEAADYVHVLDPSHPVIYRDAEDVYMDPIAKALEADRLSRPWFVYGMNFFTYRIDQALRNGPASRMKQPLLISELGPAGLRPADRARGYLIQWNMLRNHSQQVLGGSIYVWTTEGPEPLDRSFGLTDANGVPTDGSLFALADVFLKQE